MIDDIEIGYDEAPWMGKRTRDIRVCRCCDIFQIADEMGDALKQYKWYPDWGIGWDRKEESSENEARASGCFDPHCRMLLEQVLAVGEMVTNGR